MGAILLLSGGLDSSVCLAKAITIHKKILAITFDYGQKARIRELNASEQLANYYGIHREVIKLDFLQTITQTSLVSQDQQTPEPGEGELDDIEGAAWESAQKVWVPNRNGLFINIAACYADAQDYQWIITGFNREEAVTFPDNTQEFLNRSTMALELSTLKQPKVYSYTQALDKVGIVKLGQQLALPFKYIWSCYHGHREMCGKCESCQRYFRALLRVGLTKDSVGRED
ncbi:MAG: 7-cyano-7-deazaguanine synthase QueC [Carboxydocellales bacterium]